MIKVISFCYSGNQSSWNARIWYVQLLKTPIKLFISAVLSDMKIIYIQRHSLKFTLIYIAIVIYVFETFINPKKIKFAVFKKIIRFRYGRLLSIELVIKLELPLSCSFIVHRCSYFTQQLEISYAADQELCDRDKWGPWLYWSGTWLLLAKWQLQSYGQLYSCTRSGFQKGIDRNILSIP